MQLSFEEFRSRYPIPLNDQQLSAVRAAEGPVLLLAVPGSGKTTVLVTRLGYMMFCRGIPAENILTLTYTVAATRDMKERFCSFFGEEAAGRLSFRTINGICASIINEYGRRRGKTAFRLVSDETRVRAMLSDIWQTVEGSYPAESDLSEARSLIAYIKNNMLSDEGIRALEDKCPFRISEISRLYNERLRAGHLMDFDDQMVYAWRILRQDSATLAAFSDRFPYLCVDEAQDTSYLQHQILTLLARRHGNLFMVGDEDQSIYAFRAAYPKALLDFEKTWPGARILLMEENFRSSANIVRAADRFIQKNTERRDKHMYTRAEEGSDIRILRVKSRYAQHLYLQKAAPSFTARTAVLYRDNESVIPLIDLLDRAGIPFRIRSAELSFFTHRTVRDVCSILRFAHAPEDTDCFLLFYYKLLRFVSKKEAQEACRISRETGLPVLDALGRVPDLRPASEQSRRLLKSQFGVLRTLPTDKAILYIRKQMGYDAYLERSNLSGRKMGILQMLARQEPGPLSFLDRLNALDLRIQGSSQDPSCPLILSTIHASKGLEYDTVYLLDVIDGIFPESTPDQSGFDLRDLPDFEEQRRVFYVAVTRAKKRLLIFEQAEGSTFTRDLCEDANRGWYGTGAAQMRGKDPRTGTGRSSAAGGAAGRGAGPTGRMGTGAGSTGRAGTGAGRASLPPYAAFLRGSGPTGRRRGAGDTDTAKDGGYAVFRDHMGEGIQVVHRRFGEGVIAHMEGDSVTIDFDGVVRKMYLPALYEKHLLREKD